MESRRSRFRGSLSPKTYDSRLKMESPRGFLNSSLTSLQRAEGREKRNCGIFSLEWSEAGLNHPLLSPLFFLFLSSLPPFLPSAISPLLHPFGSSCHSGRRSRRWRCFTVVASFNALLVFNVFEIGCMRDMATGRSESVSVIFAPFGLFPREREEKARRGKIQKTEYRRFSEMRPFLLA